MQYFDYYFLYRLILILNLYIKQWQYLMCFLTQKIYNIYIILLYVIFIFFLKSVIEFFFTYWYNILYLLKYLSELLGFARV
jgi:hypothetical protein